MRSMGYLALALTCLALVACSGPPLGTQEEPESTGRIVGEAELERLRVSANMAFSTGLDSYKRVLALTVTDLDEEYAVGAPILITLDIINYAQELDEDGSKPGHPQAQLFPFITVWVKDSTSGKETGAKIKLPIENRIWIEPGETFTHTMDLSKAETLEKPGLYDVSVGHRNGMVLDMGDWTGTLRSRPQTIRIVPK